MVEDKIFKLIAYVSIGMSIISIIGNFICKFPFAINIKWILLIITGSLILYFFENEKFKNPMRLFFFLTVIFGFLPFGWIDSGGSKNNTIAYVFLILICTTFLFKGKTRAMLVFSLISMAASLYLFEHFFPHLICAYNEESQFIDRIIQIPLTLTAGFFLIRKFSKAYEEEKTKQEFYANYDQLTGLLNRRKFDIYLNDAIELKNSNQADLEIYLILIDIDNFKNINDTKGHLVGDEILKIFSWCAKKIMDDKNRISRWGGDEFAILYYGKYDDLYKEIKLIQNCINKSELVKALNVTLSAGVADIFTNDSVLGSLSRADRALYSAKENGKNCIKAAEDCGVY